MKKTVLALFFMKALTLVSNAQKIESKKIFGGYKYTMDGKKMTMNDLITTMTSNQEAFNLTKRAKSNTTLSQTLGFAGGFLIGWPIGTAIGGGDANWTLAGIGAAIIAITIPINSGAFKKINQAIKLHNSSLSSISHFKFKLDFKIFANGNGLGFSMSF